MGNVTTQEIVVDGRPMTITVEEITELLPPDPPINFDGPRPSKLSKRPCKCQVSYDNDIWIDHGPRTDTYVYCAKCGRLKEIMGS